MKTVLAPILTTLGLALFVWSLGWGTYTTRQQERDPGKALALVQGFRVGIIGLSLAGIGAGWLWHSHWLLGLSLIIGGEELLESTVIITALKQAPSR
jgi:hypothetical protein